jgi:hypothetical protein
MNANELVDELEKDAHWIEDELARKWVVDMLRQQQAEIEALKAELVKWQPKPYQYQKGMENLA